MFDVPVKKKTTTTWKIHAMDTPVEIPEVYQSTARPIEQQPLTWAGGAIATALIQSSSTTGRVQDKQQ